MWLALVLGGPVWAKVVHLGDGSAHVVVPQGWHVKREAHFEWVRYYVGSGTKTRLTILLASDTDTRLGLRSKPYCLRGLRGLQSDENGITRQTLRLPLQDALAGSVYFEYHTRDAEAASVARSFRVDPVRRSC